MGTGGPFSRQNCFTSCSVTPLWFLLRTTNPTGTHLGTGFVVIKAQLILHCLEAVFDHPMIALHRNQSLGYLFLPGTLSGSMPDHRR